MHKSHGWTLLELLITLSLLFIITTYSAITWRSTSERVQSTIVTNKLFHFLHFARSEAIKRNKTVTICATENQTKCTSDWSTGALIFIDEDNDGVRSENETILFSQAFSQPMLKIHAIFSGWTTSSLLRYHSDGTTNKCGSFFIRSIAKNRPLDRIVLYHSGRARITHHIDLFS